jgi:hypothetical protein
LAQARANLILAQLVKINAKSLAVGILRVVFALAGEIGINLKAMADVADDQKRRPAFAGRQGLGVVLGLLAGIDHENIPCPRGGALTARICRPGSGVEKAALQGFRFSRPAALLGLKDKGAALVKIDASARRSTVRLAKSDGTLEHISVQCCVMGRGIGARHLQRIAKLGKKWGVVGALLAAIAGGPAGDEGVEAIGWHGGRLA